ncbi:DUF4269 domain-containing protein [Halobacillus rhizosphaerae]|uniref:DUF4269 domain-containing protein n=1 Tax=Halobacillus rhizosphaerae TaxID=3064889 RepID=UPI00398B46AF
MMDLLAEMKRGNNKQKAAYLMLAELEIFSQMRSYHPVLCGTIPLGIDVENSDLDIIMEVTDLKEFEQQLRRHYGDQAGFTMKNKMIRGREVVKANFIFQNFEVEIFGQHQPVHKQNAYLHMIIEFELLKETPALKNKVKDLKKRGYNTESAFCELLGLPGDPFVNLIAFGRRKGII